MICACSHPKGLHLPDRCRVNGCACTGFRDASANHEAGQPTTTRRVSIDVPDGYMLSISLVPYTEALAIDAEPPAEPTGEGATDGS